MTSSAPNGQSRPSLARWYFAEAPADRLGIVRLVTLGFCTGYLILQAKPLLRVSQWAASAFRPVGPVTLLDNPLPASVVWSLYGLCVLCGGLATIAKYYRFTGPAFALLLLWVTSYRNSWGMVFHTENLFVLHAGVLACTPQAGRGFVWDSARTRLVPCSDTSWSAEYGWPLRVLSMVTVCTYVVAGAAKLLHAGPAWAGGHEIRTHIAFDAVRKLELGSVHSPLGALLVQVEWVFAPLAIATLAFELGAPLALLGGRWARTWCLVAWGFHLSVLLLMAIVFPYPLLGFAYASFFAVEVPVRRWLGWSADPNTSIAS